MDFKKPDIEEYFRSFTVSTFAVNKDETKAVFGANLSGKFNIWGLDIGQNYPYLLSVADQTPGFLAFDPMGRYLLTSFDHNGDENHQIMALPPTGGQVVGVREAEGRRHYFGGLSKDGNRLYYTSDKENHTFLNIYRYDFLSKDEQILHEGSGGATTLVAIAPDESSFVYAVAYANTYVLPYVAVGSEELLLTPANDCVHSIAGLSYLDAETILFTTDYSEDHFYLASYHIPTRTFKKLIVLADADVGAVEISSSGEHVYFIGHHGVEDRLYRYDVAKNRSVEVPFSQGVIEQLYVSDAGTVYLLARSDVTAANLFMKKNGQPFVRLTNNQIPGVAASELVVAQTVTYPSFDGLQIEALWFEAKPEIHNGYTIVWPHGGPQWAERRMFRPFFQYLLSRGYNVFSPNFRGSTGYGSAFTKMVEGDWGYGPRLDMVHGIEWGIQTGRLDPDKLFLIGGSYGGYMSLLLHGRHATYFQAVVDLFGPSDLLTFVNSVPDHWKPMMKQWLGDPETDRDRLVSDSPITYLDGMSKPMLVVQGANDPRVVQSESDQLVAALKDRGVQVEYLLLPDEGHGFSKKENEILVYKRIMEFLERHHR